MDFLLFPKVVYEDILLPKLRWNDLLRFRRVCSATRDAVDCYIKLEINSDLAPEIEMDEDEKTFGKFLKMGIPTSRIFLNNVSGPVFYENSGNDGCRFIKKYGSKVKHLRVRQISYYLHGKEWIFMNSMVNLQTFEAGHFGGWDERKTLTPLEIEKVIEKQRRLWYTDLCISRESWQFPDFFEHVRSLKIGNNYEFDFGSVDNIIRHIEQFLDSSSLEYALLPFSSEPLTMLSFTGVLIPGLNTIGQHPMAFVFVLVARSITSIGRSNPIKSRLEVFDFSNYHGDSGTQVTEGLLGSEIFILILCKSCIEKNVKLMKVRALWFYKAWLDSLQLAVGVPILSLVNLHPSAVSFEMPNLEEIEIREFLFSSPGRNWRDKRKEWGALKSLDINVESRVCGHYEIFGDTAGLTNVIDGSNIFQFFFQDICRPMMTEMRLNFETKIGPVAIPKMRDIVSACPNLRKLTLINWPGTNKALTKVFERLTDLEEITLEDCKDLGNVAFVGTDVGNPDFLKLTNLKRLSLRGLDKMPKITDTLFSLIIRHLKLSHLTLTSVSPLKSVTATGIRSLLEGAFADSIEKFPFNGWSMSDVSPVKFKQLGSKFRSSRML